MSAPDVPHLPAPLRALLAAVAPPDELPFLLDDAAEELAERTRAHGRARALRWAVSQTLRSLGPLAVARIRSHRAARRLDPPGDPMFTRLADDLRYSWRVAVRRPWLSLTIVTTMALGIGATTAVFSVIDALLLRPLAFPASEQLVRLASPLRTAPGAMVVNHADFTDLARETRTLSSLGLYQESGATGQLPGAEPERLGVVEVGQGFGETLRLRPALGRLFSADEYLVGGPAAIILTHDYWASHFPGDSAVLGRSILISGRPRTIVGVLPALESHYPTGDFDLWVPLVIEPDSYLRGRYSMQLSAIARLRDGATLEQANVELAALARRLTIEYPKTNTDRTLLATPLRDTVVGPVRPMLLLLGAAVAAVLLIASANLGSLLLAHAQSRVREFAVRAAIGGAAGRIARQLLVESLMLATIGGLGGLWLARVIVRGLIAVYPTQLPRAGEIGIDWRVVALALGTTALAGLLAGLPLARQIRRLDLVRDLREGERGLGSRGRRRLLDGLVVGQLATSVALLFAAGLLLRTFAHMTAIQPGFDARNVFTFGIAPSPVRYSAPERRAALHEALFDSLRAIPGVTDVGWGMFKPLAGGGWGDSFSREGMGDAEPNLPFMQLKPVSVGYVSTLRIPLLSGRSFTRADRADAPAVALVNAALAERYYAGTNPVGKRITFQQKSIEIIGVLGNARNQSLWSAATPELYVPIEQFGWRPGTIFVRTTGAPELLERRIRGIVRAMDPAMPVIGVSTLEKTLAKSMAPERFRAILIGTLATLALLLSVLGIYGLVAWVVGRRTREIGIRIALGEDASRVRLRVLGGAVKLGAVGVAAGAVLALASARYLQAFVQGDVRPRDPMTLALTMLVLLAVTAAAAWLPARRASRVDPLTAIRTE